MFNMDDQLIQIYDYIQSYKAKRGYSPALEEMAAALGLDKGAVFHHLETMEKRGMILRPRGLLQAIKLRSRQPDSVTVIREG
jgi:DNA-binding MarR family transcriptional regulator